MTLRERASRWWSTWVAPPESVFILGAGSFLFTLVLIDVEGVRHVSLFVLWTMLLTALQEWRIARRALARATSKLESLGPDDSTLAVAQLVMTLSEDWKVYFEDAKDGRKCVSQWFSKAGGGLSSSVTSIDGNSSDMELLRWTLHDIIDRAAEKGIELSIPALEPKTPKTPETTDASP